MEIKKPETCIQKKHDKDGLTKSVKVSKNGCQIKYSELNIKHRATVHISKSVQVSFHLPVDLGRISLSLSQTD